MRRKIVLILILAGFLPFCGCVSRSSSKGGPHADKQRALTGVLKQYGRAIRENDVSGVMELLDPELDGIRSRSIRRQVSLRTWLRMYTGYRVQMAATLQALSVEDMERGRPIELNIVGMNSEGVRITDIGWMRHRDSDWYIEDLQLTRPPRGAVLDIPPGDEDGIMRAISPLMKALKGQEIGRIVAMLPDNETALLRTVEPGLLGRLFGGTTQSYSLVGDIQRLRQFKFTEWPDSDEKPVFVYVGPKTVMALYDVPYTWQKGNAYDNTLRIEILLTLIEGEWRIELLRLHGKGIPGTQ